MDTTQIIPASPRRHFGFSQCSGCIDTPCMMLRGENRSGSRYVFVHRRNYGYADCPLAVRSEHDLENYLASKTFDDLCDDYSSVQSALGQDDLLEYNQSLFLNGWGDFQGRVNYIMHLYRQQVIAAVGVPFDWQSDSKMRQWFFIDASTIVFPGEVHREQQEEEPDAAESDATTNVSITNPRWEHDDTDKRNASPTAADIDDAVKLKVDIAGLNDGATVSFRICDTSVQPPCEIDVIDGAVQSRIAVVDWTITLGSSTSSQAQAKIDFDARVQGRSTRLCRISLIPPARYILSV
jgi:hypothetical protein